MYRNSDFNAIMERRSNRKYIMVQFTKKNGDWGKAVKVDTYGRDTETVIKNIEDCNPGKQVRLAQ